MQWTFIYTIIFNMGKGSIDQLRIGFELNKLILVKFGEGTK